MDHFKKKLLKNVKLGKITDRRANHLQKGKRHDKLQTLGHESIPSSSHMLTCQGGHGWLRLDVWGEMEGQLVCGRQTRAGRGRARTVNYPTECRRVDYDPLLWCDHLFACMSVCLIQARVV